MFERPLTFTHGDGGTSAGRVDLYRRGAFVLESKKLKAGAHTKGFDEAMLRARSQAEGYARALPAHEGRPPFLIVLDVGHRFELYSEFSRSGATYTPFPDPRSHRIALEDLAKEEIRERLRNLWLDPLALDPSRESARVTRQIAAQLAELAKSLEASGHGAEAVAQFLMRCLFTMFAEDVKLLPSDAFRDLLQKHAEQPDVAMRMLAALWRDMDSGGFSAAIAADVLRFNGKLFKQPDTLPLTKTQIERLLQAARADWKHVEPAIFGTLLERALSPKDRHKLGAHYTPRAYVERLVLPTVIEPLRAQWSETQAAAMLQQAEGDTKEAIATLRGFHRRLCNLRVLDPACGSGNFLYVTLEHLKRLEGEVLNALDELGYRQTALALEGERADSAAGETVDPHNLLGIELNPRAAAIAEVVLWIGYLQWHFRTRGDVHPPIPVIRDFRNIENRDAVLAYDDATPVLDERGIPVTRWDGETMKKSPVTGEEIPDETARVPLWRYVNPRKAQWPQADFIVGNPPFIGASTMRGALGDGYVDALRATWNEVPESADLVMYWWHIAAQKVREGSAQRFGFITTNSIKQTFNRRVVEAALAPPLLPSGEGARRADEGAPVLPPTAKQALSAKTLAFARQLRQTSTDAESLLWNLLRNRRLHEMKFRRQHPWPPYTLDFYCHELALAVELDGSQHLDSVRDAKRDAALAHAGIQTLRYWNHDVLARTEQVLDDLWHRMQARMEAKAGAPSSVAARHLLPKGEGKAALLPSTGSSADALLPSPAGRGAGGEGALDLPSPPTKTLSLVFAIPDHPWVDSADGAAVRIAMTVGAVSDKPALLRVVTEEREGGDEVDVALAEKRGTIHADLRIGANVAAVKSLRANEGLSCPGFKLHGAGFIVAPDVRAKLEADAPIKPYRNGRDLADKPRGVFVIDLFGYEADEVRTNFPATYQHVFAHVKPERDANKRATYRDNWWIFGEPRGVFRPALTGLPRYIATVETSKHRTFQFLDAAIAPDNMLIAIALDDAYFLGVLSSQVHVTWALAAGARLGVGNDPRYNKTRCFEPFPFPNATDEQKTKIRALAEQLDAHRKRQQAAHPELTLTGMYNVLEKLRSGQALNAKEQTLHERGLVSVLKQLHDELDAAVLAAYGWNDLVSPSPFGGRWRAAPDEGAFDASDNAPSSAPSGHLLPEGEGKAGRDEALLERLVALNAQRAAEEARGDIRWLRPTFQNRAEPTAVEPSLLGSEPAAPQLPDADTPENAASSGASSGASSALRAQKPLPWPKDPIEQVRTVAELLAASAAPLSLAQIESRFSAKGAWKKRLPPLLQMLVALGKASEENGTYRAA